MDDVEHVAIVDDGDVPLEVEEVLGEVTQPLLDLLQLLVFFGVDQLQQVALLLLALHPTLLFISYCSTCHYMIILGRAIPPPEAAPASSSINGSSSPPSPECSNCSRPEGSPHSPRSIPAHSSSAPCLTWDSPDSLWCSGGYCPCFYCLFAGIRCRLT